MDPQTALLLPPVYRPYQQFSALKTSSTKPVSAMDHNSDLGRAYHVGCFSENEHSDVTIGKT